MRLTALLALVLAAPPALAQELPARKPGLWGMKISTGASFMHCIDAATDKALNDIRAIMHGEQCAKRQMQRDGDMITIDLVCDVHGFAATTQAVIAGDFESAYTVNVTSVKDLGPVLPGRALRVTKTMEARWLGPCAADQKPGDVTAGGVTVNINEIDARAK